jgi:Spy/CpxP family protein refolding chaperone
MKHKTLMIVVFATAQMFAANFVSAQTVSANPDAPATTPGPPPFGKPNLSDVLTLLLSLTDAQKAQLQPYIDVVQHQLETTHQQGRQSEDALLKQLYESIRPLLTPEQRIKLDGFAAIRAAGPPPLTQPLSN